MLVVMCVVVSVAVFIIHNSIPDPMPAYACLYFVGFVGLAWVYPQTALLITFAGAPFQNDLSGNSGPFRFSMVEVNTLVISVVFAMRMANSRAVLRFGPAIGASVVYMALCVVSSLGNWTQQTTTAFVQTFLYLIVIVTLYASYTRDEKEFKNFCYALLFVCVGLSCITFASGTAYVLGLHKNGVGGSLATGAVIAAELWLSEKEMRRKWQLGAAMAIVVCGLIYSLSRGAWMGTIVGLSIVLLIRQQIRLYFQILIGLVPLVYILWNNLPQEKKMTVTDFGANTDNVRLRVATIDYCWSLYQQNPVSGVGLALRKQVDATNIILVTMAETGWPGLLAFLLIHLQILRMILSLRKTIPKSDPRFSIMVIAMALVMAKLVHGVVDHYWSRGTITIVWASVGVATGLYYSVRKEKRFESNRKIIAPPKVGAAN